MPQSIYTYSIPRCVLCQKDVAPAKEAENGVPDKKVEPEVLFVVVSICVARYAFF